MSITIEINSRNAIKIALIAQHGNLVNAHLYLVKKYSLTISLERIRQTLSGYHRSDEVVRILCQEFQIGPEVFEK